MVNSKVSCAKTAPDGVAISELPAAEKLTGEERFPLVQANETKGATVDQIKELIPAGDAGASAYEIWAAAQEEGADTTEEAYLAFQEGKPGTGGDNGASAYDIWVGAQDDGADTSLEAYLVFQEGKVGSPGNDGKSTYQIWLDAGHEGEEEDFLNWLKVTASVTLDPLSTNIIKQNNDGLYVNGAHPVIPKITSASLSGLLDTVKHLADGSCVYTMSVSMKNPLGINSLGGVGIYMSFSLTPEYLFLNSDNKLIQTQYYPIDTTYTASTITIKIAAIMSDTPDKSYTINGLELKGSADDGALQCPVSVKLITGTTLAQNGMA